MPKNRADNLFLLDIFLYFPTSAHNCQTRHIDMEDRRKVNYAILTAKNHSNNPGTVTACSSRKRGTESFSLTNVVVTAQTVARSLRNDLEAREVAILLVQSHPAMVNSLANRSQICERTHKSTDSTFVRFVYVRRCLEALPEEYRLGFD